MRLTTKAELMAKYGVSRNYVTQMLYKAGIVAVDTVDPGTGKEIGMYDAKRAESAIERVRHKSEMLRKRRERLVSMTMPERITVAQFVDLTGYSITHVFRAVNRNRLSYGFVDKDGVGAPEYLFNGAELKAALLAGKGGKHGT